MGAVVDRTAAGRGVLDTGVVLQVIGGQEPAPASARSPCRRERIQGAERAAGDADVSAVARLRAVSGCDVDHGRGALAVLRGQRAVEQLDAFDHAGIQRLPEAGNGFGQHHAIDAVLQVGVIATYVQLAERILHHARSLQDHLVQGRGSAERQLRDRLAVDHVFAAAGRRRQPIARPVERRVHVHGVQGQRLRSGSTGRGIVAVRARRRQRAYRGRQRLRFAVEDHGAPQNCGNRERKRLGFHRVVSCRSIRLLCYNITCKSTIGRRSRMQPFPQKEDPWMEWEPPSAAERRRPRSGNQAARQHLQTPCTSSVCALARKPNPRACCSIICAIAPSSHSSVAPSHTSQIRNGT